MFERAFLGMGVGVGGIVFFVYAITLLVLNLKGEVANRTLYYGVGTPVLAALLFVSAIWWDAAKQDKSAYLLKALCSETSTDHDYVEQLLQEGADPNAEHSYWGRAIDCAVGEGDVIAARKLMAHGADPDRTYDPETGATITSARQNALRSKNPRMRALFEAQNRQ